MGDDSTEKSGKKSFWETLPGILTGAAAVLTALAGLLTVIYTRGSGKPTEDQAKTAIVEDARPAPPKANPKRVSNVLAQASQTADISGVWKDPSTGISIRVKQNGSRFTAVWLHPMTGQQVASGQGTVNGRKISSDYRWMDGTPYTASLRVSEEGDEITGSYRSPATGETGGVLVTR